MKNMFILSLAVWMPLVACHEKRSYFDTKFLAQTDAVRQQLIQKEGFVEGFFSTSDGFNLHYLWLSRPEARCTVICSSGFWPGLKEGMATVYELLPHDCNILLFDARAHGMSDGSLWCNLLKYGEYEYKDVIGAVQWAHTQSKSPIILMGVCAGAFHATHAILNMQKQNLIEQYNIKGLIFDSGWSSLTSIVPTVLSGEWKKRMMKSVKTAPRMVQHGVRLAVMSPVSFLIKTTTPPLAWLFISKKARQATLQSKMAMIKTSVLYIHSEDDLLAPIETVKQLAQKTQQAHTWWIAKPSTHACHHLKYPDAYKEKLNQFIQSVISV